MAKVRAKKGPLPRKRDTELEAATKAKRRARALRDANREIGRLARQLSASWTAARAALFNLATEVAREHGLQLRPRYGVSPAGPVERATDEGSIGTGPDSNRVHGG